MQVYVNDNFFWKQCCVHDVIFENGGGGIFVSLNTQLCVNVALVALSQFFFFVCSLQPSVLLTFLKNQNNSVGSGQQIAVSPTTGNTDFHSKQHMSKSAASCVLRSTKAFHLLVQCKVSVSYLRVRGKIVLLKTYQIKSSTNCCLRLCTNNNGTQKTKEICLFCKT